MTKPFLPLFIAVGIATFLPAQRARSQQPNPPDCIFTFTTTAIGNFPNATGLDNHVNGCVTWTMQVNSTGFTALSVTFQSATGATAPGTYGTYSGTVVTGVNPIVATDGSANVTQFANKTVDTPWVRVNVAGLMGVGTINGVLYGYKTGYSAGGASGTCATLAGDITGTCAATVMVKFHTAAFAGLGTPGNDAVFYCTDCTVTSSVDNTCAGSGGGAVAERINGAWKCFL